MSHADKGWNGPEKAKFGLEIAKVIIGIFVAWWVWNLGHAADVARNKEEAGRAEQTRLDAQVKAIVDKRLMLWDKISPGMNDIYCYFMEVGDWKDLDGRKVLARKREVDAIMYSNQIMWDAPFFQMYERFMAEVFRTYRGQGLNAALRTTRAGRSEPTFPKIDFTNEDNDSTIFDTYWAFQRSAADELNVKMPVQPDRNKTLAGPKRAP
jgi:hypothetical protein